ncbi:hypothetical protein AYK26_03100 [Euryarchaeota archaeon SM23-78]|nr:MAG: hypothetical protein AYK26_03100 [Euryarchaeota archaeon SM23-78]MBW3000432.1 hypothetical protein [Candidatus Woesearchaeota archaeon]
MTSKTAKQRIARNYYRYQKGIFDPIPAPNPLTELIETRTEPIKVLVNVPAEYNKGLVPQKGNGKGNGKSNGNSISKNGAGNYQHGFTNHNHKQRMIRDVFSFWTDLKEKRWNKSRIDYKRQKPSYRIK